MATAFLLIGYVTWSNLLHICLLKGKRGSSLVSVSNLKGEDWEPALSQVPQSSGRGVDADQ